ncbi:MAG TPA: M42 family metallopeptidase [Ktedonobacteraceae bacterium]|nr:M42 family metallopeptidase [Ktedonobacteraceae bacterium]
MFETQYALLQRLVASPSPSGFEQRAQQVVREELQAYADEIRTDVHGNVIAALNPSGNPRVMLTAHIDELGFLIRYIDDEGYLYFSTIGGFDASTLPGGRVIVHTPDGPVSGVIGCRAVHLLDSEERGRAPSIRDMWIDIGATGAEEARQLVPLGSAATRAAQPEILRGELVVSRALDNKSGICAIIEAMRRLHERREQLSAAVFMVSAVQEEVGTRGARTGAYSVDPQVALTVDVTFASDHPHTSKIRLGDVKLGGGPGITIGGFVNPRIYEGLMATAGKAEIAYQYDISPAHTGTDNDNIQVTRGGVATGLLNIPCRYMHSGSEVVSLKDIDATAELIAQFVLILNEETNLIP